jgi:hypothetical protein
MSGLIMKKPHDQTLQFAICLNNEGYPASLEVGKLYRVIPDDDAAVHGYLRVIDESGEDYAFTASRFHVIELPLAVGQALLSASHP